jgi:NAD(P)-dependent dehydrogenase (short-subunit alcohol dehydrogenase family)
VVNDAVFDRFRLDGRTAIVTGVGPGIGANVATAFALAGANVVMSARTNDRMAQVQSDIEGQGGTAISVLCDVGVEDDLQRLVDAAHDAFGSVDVLFNNAASSMQAPRATNLDNTDEDWLSCFEVNVLGPFRLARMLVPEMKARGKGSIINVITTAAYTVIVPQIAYGCTKAALAMMTRYLAKECAPEVRVNALCPGTTAPVGFPASEATGPMAGVMPYVPMGRVGSAEEHIGAALFLASDASSYTTGQVTFVDGGRVNTLGGTALLREEDTKWRTEHH